MTVWSHCRGLAPFWKSLHGEELVDYRSVNGTVKTAEQGAHAAYYELV